MNYESIPLEVNAEEPEFDSFVPRSSEPLRSKSEVYPDEFEVVEVNPVHNQGSLGACVGFSVKEAVSYFFPKLDLSALWIYKEGQKHDHLPGEDYSGTTIGGACLAIKKKGVCEEECYPYPTGPKDPNAELNAKGQTIVAFEAYRASDETKIMDLLMDLKRGFSFSIHVHKNFYGVNKSGFINEAGYLKSEKRGGHAMAIVGWKTVAHKRYWKIKNSWGDRWGDKGYCFISFDLMEKISKGVYVIYKDNASRSRSNVFSKLFGVLSKIISKITEVFRSFKR